MDKFGADEIWNYPLICSQGGIPYNNGHIEYWKRRSEHSAAEIERLTAEVERLRATIMGIINAAGPECDYQGLMGMALIEARNALNQKSIAPTPQGE